VPSEVAGRGGGDDRARRRSGEQQGGGGDVGKRQGGSDGGDGCGKEATTCETKWKCGHNPKTEQGT
jgi:hypothetical protein